MDAVTPSPEGDVQKTPVGQVGMSAPDTDDGLTDLVDDAQGLRRAAPGGQLKRDSDVSSHKQNLPS